MNFRAPVSVHLLLIRENSILLLRRFNTGYEDGKYSLVAGHLDAGETLKSAMIREAKEEAGIEISPSELAVIGVIHSKSDKEYIHFFLEASEWAGEVSNMEPGKCDDLSWFDIQELPENTIQYIRLGVENYLSNIWFGSIGWQCIASTEE